MAETSISVSAMVARTVSVVVFLIAFITPAVVRADPIATTAEVLRVVDGDTIDIRDDVRGRLRVRILGIFPVKSAC